MGALERPGDGEIIESCSIIVGPPNELVAPIHNRLAVILPVESYSDWLDPELKDVAALKAMLRPYPSRAMAAYPVSRHVNKPAHDDPACIEPVAA